MRISATPHRRGSRGARITRGLMLSSVMFAAGASSGWADVGQSVRGRVQVGMFQDSNVLERLSDEEGDQALQLFGSAQHQAQLSERLTVQTLARLGVLRYREITEDSRVMGNGNVTLLARGEGGAGAGVRGFVEGRDYADSSSSRGFGLFRGEVFLRFPVASFLVEAVGGRTSIAYRAPGQAQRGNRFDVAVGHMLGRHLNARVRGGFGAFSFDRRATRVVGDDPQVQTFAQRDDFVMWGAELSYLRVVNAQLEYAYRRNDSNSFGASYRSHRVEASIRRRLFASPFTAGVLLRFEFRSYDDPIDRFDVINFDSEREENNYVLFEAGRPVTSDVRVKARMGWRRNESIFRDQLYDKLTGEVHLEWEF